MVLDSRDQGRDSDEVEVESKGKKKEKKSYDESKSWESVSRCSSGRSLNRKRVRVVERKIDLVAEGGSSEDGDVPQRDDDRERSLVRDTGEECRKSQRGLHLEMA